MSYRKSHIKNKIYKSKPKKPIFLKLWFWIVVLVLAVVFAVVYFLFFYSGLQVKNIKILGNQKTSSQEIQGIVANNLTTGLVKFGPINISSKSILLVNLKKINESILKNLPLINSIKIGREFPQTLSVTVSERKPVGYFCDDSKQCFFIDQDGVAFQPTTTNNDYPIVRQTTEIDKTVFAGEDVVNQNIITAITKIEKDLKDNFQINLTDVLVSNPLRMNVTTSENWQIYFDTGSGSDIDSQLTKLNLLLKGDITPDIRKTLQYIDLRFKNRAYYK